MSIDIKAIIDEVVRLEVVEQELRAKSNAHSLVADQATEQADESGRMANGLADYLRARYKSGERDAMLVAFVQRRQRGDPGRDDIPW